MHEKPINHNPDFLHDLPIELAYLILSYCDEETIFESTIVSRRWYLLCKDNYLWFQLYQQHHGIVYPSSNNIIDYKHLYKRKTQ